MGVHRCPLCLLCIFEERTWIIPHVPRVPAFYSCRCRVIIRVCLVVSMKHQKARVCNTTVLSRLEGLFLGVGGTFTHVR